VATVSQGEEVEGQDEEFLFHLTRGSELLARGESEPARASLERALELRAKDAKVLGLLGQAYYRLARYDDAGKVWQKLVDDNPVEPSARVNLGLARLEVEEHSGAIEALGRALRLGLTDPVAQMMARYGLLVSFRARGDTAQAVREWRRLRRQRGVLRRWRRELAQRPGSAASKRKEQALLAAIERAIARSREQS